jgi:hypothetical protein
MKFLWPVLKISNRKATKYVKTEVAEEPMRHSELLNSSVPRNYDEFSDKFTGTTDSQLLILLSITMYMLFRLSKRWINHLVQMTFIQKLLYLLAQILLSN